MMLISSVDAYAQTKGEIVQVFLVKDSTLTEKLTFEIAKGNTYQAFCFGEPAKGKQPLDTTGVLCIHNPKAFKKKQSYELVIKIKKVPSQEVYQVIKMELVFKE